MATALALVTIFGSIAIFVLPWLAAVLGLSHDRAGLWIGASVQEVAQVVTAGGAISASALATATVSKLARVVLLAPLVAGAGCCGRAGNGSRARPTSTSLQVLVPRAGPSGAAVRRGLPRGRARAQHGLLPASVVG
ncbi:putative sulfate exporter family transporter [Oerskovia sp. M15]